MNGFTWTSRTCIAAACFVMLIHSSAAARDISTAELMSYVVRAAQHEADLAAKQGNQRDAKTWSQWANLYGTAANNPANRTRSALKDLAQSIQWNREHAARAGREGREDWADHFDASVWQWKDLRNQLRSNAPKLTVRFPRKQMLDPKPGMPSSPWQSMQPEAGHLPQANRANNPQANNNDPMPQPDYKWAHGSRYTGTKFKMLAAWFQRQTHLTEQQKRYWVNYWRDHNATDAERENDWIQRTFGNPFQ